MVKPSPSRTGGKRQRTREALINATLEVVEERGFVAASLDEIAARAGVTKGAIYSNFRTKGELMWEAAGRRGFHLVPELTPGAPIVSQARAVARAVMALMPQVARDAAFHRELQAYVRTDPDLLARQAAQYTALFDAMAAQLERDFPDQLAVPARQAALAIQALAWGFINQWSQSPDEVTEAVVTAAFEALARGMARPQATRR